MCVVYMLDRLLGDLTIQATGRPPPKKRPSVFFVPFQLAVTKHPETHRGSLLSAGIVLRTGLVPGVLVVTNPWGHTAQGTRALCHRRMPGWTMGQTHPILSLEESAGLPAFCIPSGLKAPRPLSHSISLHIQNEMSLTESRRFTRMVAD